MSDKIEKLASQVLLLKRLYYTGKATVKDEVYDQLEAELRKADPAHPVLSLVGADAFSMGMGEEVRHNPPMLSLDKTYVLSDVIDFLRAEKDLCLTLKIDGMSMKVEYDQSGTFHRASSRGKGSHGENATSRMMHVPSLPKRMPAKTLPKGYCAEVRGELYFPLSAFEEFKGPLELTSFRNAVSGIIGRKDLQVSVPVLESLRFVAYELILRVDGEDAPISPDELSRLTGITTQTQMLEALHSMGFEVPEHVRLVWKSDPSDQTQGEQAEKIITDFFDVQGRDMAFDGEVFRVNSIKRWHELGAVSHHPRGSLAFKRAGDTAVTRILGIYVGVGRTGQISFTAELAPVELSGAQISSATLHNIELIESRGYAPGACVRIIRSGEVIPKVLEKLEADDPEAAVAAAISAGAKIEPFTIPKNCICGSTLEKEGPHLFCRNSNCAGRSLEGLVYFIANLGVKGVSHKIIAKLIAAGLVKAPADFFRLTLENLMSLDGFAKRSAENVLTAIQAKKVVDVGLFFSCLGIPGVGRSKSKELAGLFLTVKKMMSLTQADLAGIKGWGPASIEAYLTGIEERRGAIEDLLTVMEVKDKATPAAKTASPGAASGDGGESSGSEDSSTTPLLGKSVVITGSLSKPRKDIEQMIEAAGGKNGSSVTAKTSYLVCNETSASSKNKKAAALGVKVISEAELLALLGVV